MVGLSQRALAHVGCWKTPGRAGQGQAPSHFQNLPRAGSPQGPQPSECIRLPLPPARSAVGSHQQHAHSPRGGWAEGLLSSSAQPPSCPAGVPDSPGFQPCFCYCPRVALDKSRPVICCRMDGLWSMVDQTTPSSHPALMCHVLLPGPVSLTFSFPSFLVPPQI